MKITPLDDLVTCVKQKESDQTKGGLYLPKSGSLLDQGSLVADVVAVGPNVKSEKIKVGGKILFHNSPQWLKHEIEDLSGKKVEYIVISERNISAVLED